MKQARGNAKIPASKRAAADRVSTVVIAFSSSSPLSVSFGNEIHENDDGACGTFQ